jgi:general secretion pathway protein A
VYAKHFGLRQEPFSIAPDPRYLFMSERHREALAHLLYGLKGTGGVVLLTGEIGAGKTTVCRCFLEQIPAKCNVAYIFNPKLTVTELLETVCEEFRIARNEARPRQTVKDYVDAINGYLLQKHAMGENNVLIIDEAQNLSADVLEQLRLLTNLETSERKLLQIVLIGQPELRTLLQTPEMEQLAQRVTARYHLEALNEQETSAYIRHRLVIAGRTGGNPFDGDARQRIHKLSRGVPRRINLLCDRALLGAYARGTQRVSAAMINEAADEVFGRSAPRLSDWRQLFNTHAPWSWVASGALASAVLLGLVMWALPARKPGPAVVAAKITPAPSTATSPAASAVAAPAPSSLSATGPIATTPPSLAASVTVLPAVNEIRDEQEAWRLLALFSQISLPPGEPCQVAKRQNLACDKRSNAKIDQLKTQKRPALLTLRNEQREASYIIHTGVSDNQTITVRGEGGDRVRLDLGWLAPRWRGEIASFKPLPTTAAASSVTP